MRAHPDAISDAGGFHGVVDLVTMEAFHYTPNGDGRGKITGEIPASIAQQAKEAHEALVELVAEGKDELMEEFFAEGTIPEQHLITALHEAIREDRIFPVLFASGGTNVATDHLLDFIKVYAPASTERSPIPVKTAAMQAVAANGGSATEGGTAFRKVDDGEPAAIVVFKTMSDPFAGRITFFKVVSGCVKNEASLENYTRRSSERFSHLSVMQGRKAVEVPELHAGDLGAVAKLKDTLTGDTLGAKGGDIQVELATMPEPAMTYAIEPKSRADEDKLAPAIHKLMEEDLLIRFFRDPQTNEFLIAGAGQPHIEAIVSRLKKRYHAEVTLKAPKVPYRETIRGKADAQGRHKKQSGGHGQFGDCKVRMEPLPRGGGFEFASEVFGGAIPRNFIPAIEKGVVESAARGFLAGYPVVDFKVIVYDGSYHDVDSNELSFKKAGRLAFRKAMEQAKPCLLEPVMKVAVEAPDEFAGTLMGDLHGRRGRVQGRESKGRTTVINAEVPMAEMLTYGAQLTSMTQGKEATAWRWITTMWFHSWWRKRSLQTPSGRWRKRKSKTGNTRTRARGAGPRAPRCVGLFLPGSTVPSSCRSAPMIDLSSPALRRNPFPVYAQARSLSPVFEDPSSGCWLLFDYESVKRALTDHEHFSSNMTIAGRGNPDWMIFDDPPRHTKLRALISRAFTPTAIGYLEPRILPNCPAGY